MIICPICNAKHSKMTRNGRCTVCSAKLPINETPDEKQAPKEPVQEIIDKPEIKTNNDIFGELGISVKPKKTIVKPTAVSEVKTIDTKEKHEYIIFGKKFSEGEEKKCLMFLLTSFQINYVFKDLLSKNYSDKFLFLVKNYYSQNDQKVKELISEFSYRLDSYSREEIFYMTFIYLFNHSVFIINKQSKMPVEFSNPIECAEFLSKDITTRNELINKYKNVFLYYLRCDDDIHSLSKRIYEYSNKVTYVGYKYGEITLLSLGDKDEFIESLTSPKYMDEKRTCIINIFDYHDDIILSNIEQNVLEFFKINSSQAKTYFFNVMYAASMRNKLTFNSSFTFTNDEHEFTKLMLRAKKEEDQTLRDFIISIFYMLKNGLFDDTNFVNIANYRIDNQILKQVARTVNSVNTLLKVCDMMSANIIDKEFKFGGSYLSINKIADKMYELSDYDLIRCAKLFNQNELDKLLNAYGVKITRKEIEKIIGELV